jgi:hypothetical protein
MRLTPLQQKFIDRNLKNGDFVAFPVDIFKGNKYKKWKRDRRKKNRNFVNKN